MMYMASRDGVAAAAEYATNGGAIVAKLYLTTKVVHGSGDGGGGGGVSDGGDGGGVDEGFSERTKLHMLTDPSPPPAVAVCHISRQVNPNPTPNPTPNHNPNHSPQLGTLTLTLPGAAIEVGVPLASAASASAAAQISSKPASTGDC